MEPTPYGAIRTGLRLRRRARYRKPQGHPESGA